MRELFLALDNDGDGQLTATEIRAGLQSASMAVPANLQKVLEAVDSDGSGVIDYTEFLAAVIDHRVYSQEDLCRAAFKLFDKDGDGTLSPEDRGPGYPGRGHLLRGHGRGLRRGRGSHNE
ncbi:unnamed protein product [Prorocentrum cordatum]|uniref:EF-hand domain-containing protein n=1 Tax=Prorocentrum cordatum TaxID=2364126 RepID=A0ABN9RHL8_9DINO|nr:unnamed protein product [Polarella glacialis]